MQRRLKLKPFAIAIIYLVVTITFISSLMLLGRQLLKVKTPITYITTSTITEDVKPVMNETKTIIRPYIDEDVTILQNYYDLKSSKEIQEKSLIKYQNTYLQNSGIDYGKKDVFEVLSIYTGKVLDVLEDDILGKIVQIEHSNNLIASYQCLSDIYVKKDDTISIGQKIGNSGSCNISKDIGNHLHLEIYKDGQVINPETIYNKTIEEL